MRNSFLKKTLLDLAINYNNHNPNSKYLKKIVEVNRLNFSNRESYKKNINNFLLKNINFNKNFYKSQNSKDYKPDSKYYFKILKKNQEDFKNYFFNEKYKNVNFCNLFNCKIPYENFGQPDTEKNKNYQLESINTVDLFSDLIPFSIYLKKKNKYKKVLDIGANIGVHSIILSKLGYKVSSFEPDPVHFSKLKRNIKLNNLKNIKLHNVALGDKNSTKNFLRVLNNTTSNHIQKSKNKPYGPIEVIKVHVKNATKYLETADFAKIDCEGAEDKIFKCLTKVRKMPDILVEIHSAKKARVIFNLSKKLNFNLFSQKQSWKLVKKFNEMPKNNKQGLLFASKINQSPFIN